MHPFTESIDILNATTPMQQENREPEKAYREKLKEVYRPTCSYDKMADPTRRLL